MPNPVAALAGSTVAAGLLQGRSAERAARTAAASELEAGRIAAEEARFKPVGITTRFGQSAFQYGPDGRVIGAQYTLSPELKAYQDRLMALVGQGLITAETAQSLYQPLMGAAPGLFGLAKGYLAETPQQAAQQYMARQQELLAPSRERQLAALENKLFQTGREGLSVGATGERPSGAAGLGATTPEREAYYNAIAQQDLELAAKSRKGGMEDILFGTGLFSTGADLYKTAYQGQVAALAPYEAYLGQAKALEALGQQPLGLGIDIGAKGQSTGAAQALLASGTGAAQRLEAANAYNPFANFLTMFSMNPTVGQGISSVFQPYIGAQQAIGQYGAGNVYGFGGGGMAPGPVTSFY